MKSTLVAITLLTTISTGSVGCSSEVNDVANNSRPKNESVVPEKSNSNEVVIEEEHSEISDLEDMLLPLVVADKLYKNNYLKIEKSFLPYTLLVGKYLAKTVSDMDIDDYSKHEDIIKKLSHYNESLTKDHQKTIQTVMGCHDYFVAKIDRIEIDPHKKLNKNTTKVIIDLNNRNLGCLKALREDAEINVDYLNTAIDYFNIQPLDGKTSKIRKATMDYLVAWEKIRDVADDLKERLSSNNTELKIYVQ